MDKIAVLGLGWWGSKLLRNLVRHEHLGKARVIGADPSAARRMKISEEYSCTVCDDARQVLADPGVSAVVIATPPPTHFQLARAALLRKKDVLLTKPPTQTVAELAELADIARSEGRVIMMDSTFVYSDAVRKVKSLLQDGFFKEIRYVQSLRYGNDLRMHHVGRLRETMLKNGINVIDDLLIHDIAILTYLFPESAIVPESVHRVAVLSRHLCDTAFIRLRTDRFPIHIGLSWTLPDRRRELLITDEEKQLVFDDLRPDGKIEVFWIEDKRLESIEHGNGEPLFAVVDHFVNCVRDRMEPFTNGDYMLKVMGDFKAVLDMA